MPRKTKCPYCFGVGMRRVPELDTKEAAVFDTQRDCGACNGTGWMRKPKKEKHNA